MSSMTKAENTDLDKARDTSTARRWTRRFGIAALSLALLTVALNFRASSQGAEASAILTMNTKLQVELKKYSNSHGYYPASLSDLEIDFKDTDTASKETLKYFQYQITGESYTLDFCRNHWKPWHVHWLSKLLEHRAS